MKVNKNDILNFKMPGDFRMKLAKSKIRCWIYKVSYTYETKRGNSRENHVYLESNGNDLAKKDFLEYIEGQNIKKPYRAISNVKILDIEFMGIMITSIQGRSFKFELPDDFQKKFISKKIEFSVYKISYERRTKYNNAKQNHMYMILNRRTNPKMEFYVHLDICSSQKNHVSISNVKILDIEKLGSIVK